MKRVGKRWFAVLCSGMMVLLNGCGIQTDENWDAKSPQEQEEIRQTLKEVREDLRDTLPEDSRIEELLQEILGAIADALEEE